MIQAFGTGWYQALREYLSSQEFMKLGAWLAKERGTKRIYPSHENMFNAFKLTPYENVKVVFLGLDPYIREGQATGLSFGVDVNACHGKIPPSLRTMLKELETDLDKLVINFDYSLKGWAEQGILMLNTALTVEQGQTGSHLMQWRGFTNAVIDAINRKHDNVIWILLGKRAQEFGNLISKEPGDSKLIVAPHPAAESYAGGKAGFFGSKIYSKCNSMLYMLEKEEIKWDIREPTEI